MSPERPTPQSPDTVYADRVFRSLGGIAGGVLLLALACWLGIDALISGSGNAPWLALAGLLFVIPLVIAFTLRPAVYANDDRLRVRNPFRTIVLPWAAVQDVRAGYSSEVFTEGGKYQLWAVPVSLRRRKRANAQQMRAMATGEPTARSRNPPSSRSSVTGIAGTESGLAPSDQTVNDLRELAERGASRPTAQGTPEIRWAYEIMAPCAAGAILLAVLLGIG